MKLLTRVVLFSFIVTFISCQNEQEDLFEDDQNLNLEIDDSNLEKNSSDYLVVCSVEGIPPGYVVQDYFNNISCPNINLFLGRYNAAVVRKEGTPVFINAGAGCSDNYCIWIVGGNFESNAYVDIRTTTGSSIIASYRGNDRTLTTNAQGQQVITLRLNSSFEKNEFASRGLRIWVVNPEARKWADGRTVRRPSTGNPIDPPCNPICP